eukprot:3564814-Rhodomonas_salina.3
MGLRNRVRQARPAVIHVARSRSRLPARPSASASTASHVSAACRGDASAWARVSCGLLSVVVAKTVVVMVVAVCQIGCVVSGCVGGCRDGSGWVEMGRVGSCRDGIGLNVSMGRDGSDGSDGSEGLRCVGGWR